MWDVITHPYFNFNGSSDKPLLCLGHGWVITSQKFLWMKLLIHELISVGKKMAPDVDTAVVCKVTCNSQKMIGRPGDISWNYQNDTISFDKSCAFFMIRYSFVPSTEEWKCRLPSGHVCSGVVVLIRIIRFRSLYGNPSSIFLMTQPHDALMRQRIAGWAWSRDRDAAWLFCANTYVLCIPGTAVCTLPGYEAIGP